MPSTEQDGAFDYENSPWVGDKILARIWYEQLEELNNPVLVREALAVQAAVLTAPSPSTRAASAARSSCQEVLPRTGSPTGTRTSNEN